MCPAKQFGDGIYLLRTRPGLVAPVGGMVASAPLASLIARESASSRPRSAATRSEGAEFPSVWLRTSPSNKIYETGVPCHLDQV
jgi:hypothetical protein